MVLRGLSSLNLCLLSTEEQAFDGLSVKQNLLLRRATTHIRQSLKGRVKHVINRLRTPCTHTLGVL
jgi:hypothetical protein